MKPEVNKAYQHPISKATFQVLHVGLHKSFGIHSTGGEMAMPNSHFYRNNWEEVVPKLTITKWVNVYKVSSPEDEFSLYIGEMQWSDKTKAKSFGKTSDRYIDTIEITYTEK